MKETKKKMSPVFCGGEEGNENKDRGCLVKFRFSTRHHQDLELNKLAKNPPSLLQYNTCDDHWISHVTNINILSYLSDIDECATGNHNCNDRNNFVCSNTKGSFVCLCADGFVNIGGSCEGEILPMTFQAF